MIKTKLKLLLSLLLIASCAHFPLTAHEKFVQSVMSQTVKVKVVTHYKRVFIEEKDMKELVEDGWTGSGVVVEVDARKEKSIVMSAAHVSMIPQMRAGITEEGKPFLDFLKDKDSLKNAFVSLKFPPVEMTASKITLFQSTLAREGSIYTILHEAKFL